MANYDVGNIEINFRTISKEAIESIASTTKALRSLNTQIKKLANTDMKALYNSFNQLTRIVTPFIDKITSASEPLKNFSNAINLAKVNAQLEVANAKVEKLKNQLATRVAPPISDEKIVLSSTQIDNLSAKVDKLKGEVELTNDKDIVKIQNLEDSLAKLKEIRANIPANEKKKIIDTDNLIKANLKSQQLVYNTEKIKNNVAKTNNFTLKSVLNIGKLYFLINYTKRLAQGLGKIVSNAIDLEETMNKFQVSFGQYSDEATKYVNQLTYAFNLSSESIMDYMSTFNNMLSTIGNISGNDSLKLSKALTSMAIDYASLFNVGLDTAMQQFQSALAGQIKSIRTTSGTDISDTTLYEFYQQLGGTKTIGNLSQIEKRLLRIYAIQRQLTGQGAIGDFEKTMENSANVLKQISQTWKEASQYIGKVALVYIKPILQFTLGLIIAVRDMAKAFAEVRGLLDEVNEKVGYFGETITDSTSEAEESVESLKRSLLGFDKLNVLGSTSGAGASDDVTKIIEAIATYDSKLAQVSSKSRKIADDILEWLGYTKSVNTETDEVNWTLGEGQTNLETIKDNIEGIGIALISFGIVKKAGELLKLVGSIGGALGVSAGAVAGIGLAITGVVLIFKELYETQEDFRESIDEMVASVGGVAGNPFSAITSSLGRVWSIFKDLIKELSPILSPVFINGFKFFINSMKFLVEIMENLKNLLSADIDILKGMFETVQGIVMGLGIPIKGIIEMIKTMMNPDYDGFAVFEEYITKVKDKLMSAFEDLGKGFVNVLSSTVNILITVINRTLINSINTMTSGLSNVWTWAGIPEIPQIPDIPFIPQLASGGVARESTLVNIGEYAGATTNPEIVSPQSIMRETFIEAVMPLAQAILTGNKQVIKAIEDKDVNAYLNGRKVSEGIYNDFKDVSLRKGDNLFAR